MFVLPPDFCGLEMIETSGKQKVYDEKINYNQFQ